MHRAQQLGAFTGQPLAQIFRHSAGVREREKNQERREKKIKWFAPFRPLAEPPRCTSTCLLGSRHGNERRLVKVEGTFVEDDFIFRGAPLSWVSRTVSGPAGCKRSPTEDALATLELRPATG